MCIISSPITHIDTLWAVKTGNYQVPTIENGRIIGYRYNVPPTQYPKDYEHISIYDIMKYPSEHNPYQDIVDAVTWARAILGNDGLTLVGTLERYNVLESYGGYEEGSRMADLEAFLEPYANNPPSEMRALMAYRKALTKINMIGY